MRDDMDLSDITGRDDDETTCGIFEALDRLDPRSLRCLVVAIRLDVMDADDQAEAQACVDEAICEAVQRAFRAADG